MSQLWQTGLVGQNTVRCLSNKTTYVVCRHSAAGRGRLRGSMDFPELDMISTLTSDGRDAASSQP